MNVPRPGHRYGLVRHQRGSGLGALRRAKQDLPDGNGTGIRIHPYLHGIKTGLNEFMILCKSSASSTEILILYPGAILTYEPASRMFRIANDALSRSGLPFPPIAEVPKVSMVFVVRNLYDARSRNGDSKPISKASTLQQPLSSESAQFTLLSDPPASLQPGIGGTYAY